MKLKFLGIGAAYKPSLGSNCAFFLIRDQLYMLDCGETAFCRIIKQPELRACTEVNILITHLHSDHIGSLGSLISYCVHILGKTVRVASPDPVLQQILTIMGIMPEEYEFRTDFQSPFPGGLIVRPVPADHVPQMKCFGYYLQDDTETIYYSGDASRLPEPVLARFLSGEIAHIYQETTFTAGNHPGHCSLQQLSDQIPKPYRNRVTCMHLGEDIRLAIPLKGFQTAQICEPPAARESGGPAKNVLFIGNSFTYFNNLPAMVSDLCAQAGISIHAVPVTKGGWYLKQFADPENEMGKILRQVYPEKKWDYAVLQDQSFQPAGDPESALRSIRDICGILNGGETILLYQTWAYRDRSAKLASTGMDYASMRDGLHDTYERAAKMIGGIRVPAGDAFSLCRDSHPEIELYQADSFHPSLAGSYLAACLFCRAIAGLDPLTLSDPEGLPMTAAAALRRIAKEVSDS